MCTEENKKIVRRFFEELWNARNLDAADEIFAPEYVTHQFTTEIITLASPHNKDVSASE